MHIQHTLTKEEIKMFCWLIGMLLGAIIAIPLKLLGVI